MAKFNIQIKIQALVKYVLQATDKMPKKTRADAVVFLRNKAFNILSEIVEANACSLDKGDEQKKRRRELQSQALRDIRVFEALCDVCCDAGYITKKQLSAISEQTSVIYDSSVKWIESDSRR